MDAPSWGLILPDKAGWYWVRGKNEPGRPAKVFLSKTGLLCFISADGPKMQSDFHKFQWAGPILEPI